MTDALLHITAPHFCAGATVEDGKIVDAAPILRYMKGWSIIRALAFCKEKKWRVEIT